MDDFSRRLSAVDEPLFLVPPGETKEGGLLTTAASRRRSVV
jgi:hypothetical protein